MLAGKLGRKTGSWGTKGLETGGCKIERQGLKKGHINYLSRVTNFVETGVISEGSR